MEEGRGLNGCAGGWPHERALPWRDPRQNSFVRPRAIQIAASLRAETSQHKTAQTNPNGSSRDASQSVDRTTLRAVHRDDLNFFFDVVQEVIDSGLPPSVKNVASQLVPKGREREIIEALETLVAERRLVKIPAVMSFTGDDHATTDLDYYYPSQSK